MPIRGKSAAQLGNLWEPHSSTCRADTSVLRMTAALRSSNVLTVLFGTVIWVIALIVTSVAGGVVGNLWFWTCVVGVVSGVLGTIWLARRQMRLSEADQNETSSS